MHMKIELVEQLIQIFDKSTLLEFRYEEDGTEIFMSRKGEGGQAAAPVAFVPMAPAAAAAEDDSESYITAPIVSTFYAAPTPEAKPFIAVGDRVKAGDTVCILEAMKIMTELKCDFGCEIEAVLVSNGQKVEYGQPLFRVKRS